MQHSNSLIYIIVSLPPLGRDTRKLNFKTMELELDSKGPLNLMKILFYSELIESQEKNLTTKI